MAFPLRHGDREVFAYSPPGENGGFSAAVTFTVGPDGRADGMTLENLNVDGNGRFDRETTSS